MQSTPPARVTSSTEHSCTGWFNRGRLRIFSNSVALRRRLIAKRSEHAAEFGLSRRFKNYVALETGRSLHTKPKNSSKPRTRPARVWRNDSAEGSHAAAFVSRDNAALDRRQRPGLFLPAFVTSEGGRGARDDVWPRARADSVRAQRGASRDPGAGTRSVVYMHVPAQWLDAHHRQHVVLVDFWRQRRRPFRRTSLFALLHCLWTRLRDLASAVLLGIEDSIHRRQRGDRGSAGR